MYTFVSIVAGVLADISLISAALYVAIRPLLATHTRPLMPDSNGNFDHIDSFGGCGGSTSDSACGGFGDGACH